jgi:hypothetical protein
MVQGRNTLGYLRNQTFYTPERKYAYTYASITKYLTCSPLPLFDSGILLIKCPTNLSQHSLSLTIWSDIVVGRESGYLKIFFTFLEVNMSNILWLMHMCKRTFFPVCRMSGYEQYSRIKQRNKYNIDFFYMHLFNMRQCVLNRSSNHAHYSCPR